MKKKVGIYFIVWLMLACTALSYGAGEKERMKDRAPQIAALKAGGVIGEKADGLLGFVKSSPKDKAVVDAENKDRETVYSLMAEKTGSNTAAVGSARGKANADRAASGDWLQDAKGKWRQKK